MIECGTYAGYQRHTRLKETACTPCRDAAAEHAREWRERPGARDRGRVYQRAASRAKHDLADKYRDEYQALVLKHLRAIHAESQPTPERNPS